MKNLPPVSVITLTYNEKEHIQDLFEGLQSQSYQGRMEYIFIDGCSRDGTWEIIKGYAEIDQRVRIHQCSKGLAASRLMGVVQSRYELIAMIDGDCMPPAHWLETLVDTYSLWKTKNKHIVAVGGSNIAFPQGSNLQHAIDVMKDSYLGSGGSVYGREYPDMQQVHHIASVNCLYEKGVLKEEYFSSTLHTSGEDLLMSARVSDAGGEFVYTPRATIYHQLRKSYRAWGYNMYKYGMGRVAATMAHPKLFFAQPLYFLPMGVIVSLIVLFVAYVFQMNTILIYISFLMICYLLMLFSSAVITTIRRERLGLVFRVFVLYLITHLMYGFGQWRQLLYSIIKRREAAISSNK